MARMQWWRRPGPNRPCAISNPRPSPSSMLLTGTRTSLHTNVGDVTSYLETVCLMPVCECV